jgi:predicted glycosyltransferase
MTSTTMTPEAELAMLKERADILGISYKGNIGADALRTKIADAQKKAEIETSAVEAGPETAQQMRDRLQGEALALVRVKIHNLHPEKRDLPGEIITVANRYIGTVSKFIPFGEADQNDYLR